MSRSLNLVLVVIVLLMLPLRFAQAEYELHDSHFHLTNYIQEGTDINDLLAMMGDRVGRVALFGIPLQQTWNHANTGEFAPGYYLQSDAPLYYYSFTDAYIANQYLSLSKEDRKRFDPMITGFNPADMYAVDHVKRVLKVYPGVFTGIGEFTIHKEFVSAKVAGVVASLTNPALDRLLDFAGESGLLVILHSDLDIPFQADDKEPVYKSQMSELLQRHEDATIIWAHTGLGRVIHPAVGGYDASTHERHPDHIEMLRKTIESKQFPNLYFDISWDEVAKYIVSSERSITNTAALINEYPERFLFGTDKVAPKSQADHLVVYETYQPLWQALSDEARQKVLKGNYERLFDAAARKVRRWEQANL